MTTPPYPTIASVLADADAIHRGAADAAAQPPEPDAAAQP